MSYIRGLGIPAAVVVGVSSASGCYPTAAGDAWLPLVSGSCDDSLAVEVEVLEGGVHPSVRQRDVTGSQVWQYWTEPTYLRGFWGHLGAREAGGVVRGVGADDGRSWWALDAPGGGVAVIEVAADGTVTARATVGTGSDCQPVIGRVGTQLRLHLLDEGKIRSYASDDDGVTWEARRSLVLSGAVTALEGYYSGDQVMLLARMSGGWAQWGSLDAGETWRQVSLDVTAASVGVIRAASGVWLVGMRDATTPYRADVRVLGSAVQPLLTGRAVELPLVSADLPLLFLRDPAGDVWLSQGSGDVLVTTDSGASWVGRAASRADDIVAWVWAGTGAWALLADGDELGITQAGGWDSLSRLLGTDGCQMGSQYIVMPMESMWQSGQYGSSGAGSVTLVDWEYYRLLGGAGNDSWIQQVQQGVVELDLRVLQSGSDYVELLISAEPVYGSGQWVVITVRVSTSGLSVREIGGAQLASASLPGSGGDDRARLSVSVLDTEGPHGVIVLRWIPADQTVAAVDLAVDVPWEAAGSGTIPGGKGWRLSTRAAAAGVQDVRVYRVSEGWAASGIGDPQGRVVTGYAAPLVGEVAVQAVQGQAAAGDSFAVAATFQHGHEALEAASPSRYWEAGVTGDGTVYLEPVAGHGLAGLMGLWVDGVLGRSVALEADGVEVAVLDLAAGTTDLAAVGTGRWLTAASGSEVSRWLERNELAGGLAVWSGGSAVIVSHSAGVWGRTSGFRVLLDDAAPASGDVTLVAPRGLLVWLADVTEVTAYEAVIEAVGTRLVRASQVRLVAVTGTGRQWQHGEQVSEVALEQVTHDRRGVGSVVAGAVYREVSIDWQSDPVPVGDSENVGHLDGEVGGTLAEVAAALRERAGEPVLLVRQAEAGEATTARGAAVWSRCITPVILTLVADDDGDEISGGFWRLDALRFREEC